jgi:hypothetical protein
MVWVLVVFLYAVVGLLTLALVGLGMTERRLTLKEKLVVSVCWPFVWFCEFFPRKF